MTEAKTSNYWISPTALRISLNALGNPDYLQGSTSSGAAILCYIKDIIGYDDAHNYRAWTLQLYPTVFASTSIKYVYVAIPRDLTKTTAQVCFPSERIDIYGQTHTDKTDEEGNVVYESEKNEDGTTKTDEDGDTIYSDTPVDVATQVGSTDYYYIFLQAEISASTGGKEREFTHAIEYGTLDTAEARDTPSDSEWFQYDAATGIVTFLKDLTFKTGQKFLSLVATAADITTATIKTLVLGASEFIGKAVFGSTDKTSDNTIVTPKYVEDAADSEFLRKDKADETTHKLTLADIDINGLATLFNTLKSDNFTDDFDAGMGWGVTRDGNMQVESIEVRSYMRVLELVFNRLSAEESEFVFTENGTIDTVEETVAPTVTQTTLEDGTTKDVTTGGKYRLAIRKKTEIDFTAFHVGDVLRGVVNNLAVEGPVGKEYYTAWMYVTLVDTANNIIEVTRYDDVDTPAGKNFAPASLMVLHRWGNNISPIKANYDATDKGEYIYRSIIEPVYDSDGETITGYTNSRQSCWYLSSSEKRIVMLDGVDQPIIDESNYAAFFGLPYNMSSFKEKPVDSTQPYIYVRGAFLQDPFIVDYKGVTHDPSHEFAMQIDTGGDYIIGNGETKRISCSIVDGWGNDVTSGATNWVVSRNSGDATEDSYWNNLHNASADHTDGEGNFATVYTSFNTGKDEDGNKIRDPGVIDITIDDLRNQNKVTFTFEATMDNSSESKVSAQLNIE